MDHEGLASQVNANKPITFLSTFEALLGIGAGGLEVKAQGWWSGGWGWWTGGRGRWTGLGLVDKRSALVDWRSGGGGLGVGLEVGLEVGAEAGGLEVGWWTGGRGWWTAGRAGGLMLGAGRLC